MNNANEVMAQNKGICEKHMHRYVLLQTKDGEYHDGIVESVDEENVYLAIPYCPNEERAFLPYGGGFGYGGYYPRRRFYRRGFPLAGLLALGLLPYFF